MVPISYSMEEGEDMDWYAWLSRSGLEPALAYEYALVFAHNELQQEDIRHLDHHFLLSMGVSVGKHRLEILKLARRDSPQHPPQALAVLLAAAGKTRGYLARCVRSLVARGGRRGPSALTRAQRDLLGRGQWRSTMLKRERKLVLLQQERLLLTGSGVRVTVPPPPPPPLRPPRHSALSHSASPLLFGGRAVGRGSGADGEFWAGRAAEAGEMRWDFMFRDLKPT